MEGAVNQPQNLKSIPSKYGALVCSPQQYQNLEPAVLLRFRAINWSQQTIRSPKIISTWPESGHHAPAHPNREKSRAAASTPAFLSADVTAHRQRNRRLGAEAISFDGSEERHRATESKMSNVLLAVPSQQTIISDGSSSREKSSFGGDLTQDEWPYAESFTNEHFQAIGYSSVTSFRPAKPKVEFDPKTSRHVLRRLDPRASRTSKTAKIRSRPLSGLIANSTTGFDLSSVIAAHATATENGNCKMVPAAMQALGRIGKQAPSVLSPPPAPDKPLQSPDSSTKPETLDEDPQESVEIRSNHPKSATLFEGINKPVAPKILRNLDVSASSAIADQRSQLDGRSSSAQFLTSDQVNAGPSAEGHETTICNVPADMLQPLEVADSSSSSPYDEGCSSQVQINPPVPKLFQSSLKNRKSNLKNLDAAPGSGNNKDHWVTFEDGTKLLVNNSFTRDSSLTSAESPRASALHDIFSRSERLMRKVSRLSSTREGKGGVSRKASRKNSDIQGYDMMDKSPLIPPTVGIPLKELEDTSIDQGSDSFDGPKESYNNLEAKETNSYNVTTEPDSVASRSSSLNVLLVQTERSPGESEALDGHHYGATLAQVERANADNTQRDKTEPTPRKQEKVLSGNTVPMLRPFAEGNAASYYGMKVPVEVSDVHFAEHNGKRSKLIRPEHDHFLGPQSYRSPALMRKGVKNNQRPLVQFRGSSHMPYPSLEIATQQFEPYLSETDSSDQYDEEDHYIVDFKDYWHSPLKGHRGCPGYDMAHPDGVTDPKASEQITIKPLEDSGRAHISQIPPRPIPDRKPKGESVTRDAKEYDLKDRRHYSIRGMGGFSLGRAHRRAPIARDWSRIRKRSVAGIACFQTALIGIIIGIYAGQVPAIQYIIVDENTHYAILGNVVFYIGLAITTATCWPLPLLYGRKPFNIIGLALALTLLFPQVIVVSAQRDPSEPIWRVALLLSRGVAGLVIGLTNVNCFATLLDLFGASLQSGNPHQEILNEYDVRRHGGGLGVWLGIWTCSYIGSIGLGFMVGALTVGYLPLTWGFWIAIVLTLSMLLTAAVTPETRRSAYRKSLSQIQNGSKITRRIGRGEVMMHLYATGPMHWYEEVHAGTVLSWRMVRQPGFALLALYEAWVYGQVVMVMILLGALVSTNYQLYPQMVALCVAAFPLGSVAAIPFQKASLFSRARHHPQRTDSATFQKRVSWSSHLIRRVVFMISLPIAALAYTLSSGGVGTPIVMPITFSAVIGFFSNLAISECNGIIMETFDMSDLQPGMTGRPRENIPESARNQRTNFSSFPRISAAVAVVQTFSFLIAAAATGVGGTVVKALGARTATAVVGGVLLLLTILLVAALTRARSVQIVPSQRASTAILSGPGENLPVIIGHPSGKSRRISLLEMGDMTRWTEIRRRNGLLKGNNADG